MLIGIDSVYPGGPSSSFLGIMPASIRLQDATKPDDPRGSLHIYKGHLRSHEKGPDRVRGLDEPVEGVPELFRILDLLLWVLLLQNPVEIGHDVPVDLHMSLAKP
jgi:hypothetical protein